MHYLFLVLVETEQTMEKPYEVMRDTGYAR